MVCGMADEREQERRDDEAAVAIPLDPVVALRGLLQVDPESKPVDARKRDQDADDEP